jgi:hypothetical protein
MVEHEESFSIYLAAYRALRLKLLDEMGPVAGDYPETVRTTWKRSFDAVAEAAPASIALLRQSAFFAPDAIPNELILEGASELGEPLASALASTPGGEHALNQILTPLARHSFVSRDPEARTYSVHRLVQAVLLDELDGATRKDLVERAVKALHRAFPDGEYASWPRCERLVPHTQSTRGWIESEDLRVPEAARLLDQAGYYLHLRARYAEAEPLFRQTMVTLEASVGPDQTTPTRPLASTTWRWCSVTRADSVRRSRCFAGRWRFARRRRALTTSTQPVASTTWRWCSMTRADPVRRSRCTAGRWRSAKRSWAPTTPT